MADASYGVDPTVDTSDHPSRYTNVVGAAISLAVFVGILGWAVSTMMRDASGVPTVRALQGPMTVEPEDPGGIPAEHMGLSVNRVSGSGAELEQSDLQLAPQTAVLAEEDVHGALLASERPEARPALFSFEDNSAAIQEALVETTEVEPTASVALAGTPVPSLRPQVRPSGLRRAAASVSQAVAQAVAETPTAAAFAAPSVPAGTRLAQLGAYESAALANSEWARISSKNPSFFAGKTHVVQQASKNGQQFFRLRVVGFSDAADARRFCSALIAKNLACYPVVMK